MVVRRRTSVAPPSKWVTLCSPLSVTEKTASCVRWTIVSDVSDHFTDDGAFYLHFSSSTFGDRESAAAFRPDYSADPRRCFFDVSHFAFERLTFHFARQRTCGLARRIPYDAGDLFAWPGVKRLDRLPAGRSGEQSPVSKLLRCFHCEDVIGVYEPLIAVVGRWTCVTSKAAEPNIADQADACYHAACYEQVLANSQPRIGRAGLYSEVNPNGIPSESLQIAHRSPGWITFPPRASTLSSASARSLTAK